MLIKKISVTILLTIFSLYICFQANNIICQSQKQQSVWHSQPDITNLTAQAEELLNNLSKDKISLDNGQKIAQNLYADLERAIIFQQNFKTADKHAVDKAEYMLFQLSNKFNLATPVEKLKRDYEGSIGWLTWGSSKAHGFIKTSLEQTAYVASSIAQTIAPENIAKLLGAYVGTSNIKEIIKKIALLTPGFIEPTPQLKAMIDEAIKNCGLDPDKIIVIESTTPPTWYDGLVQNIYPFSIMIIKSLPDKSEYAINSKLFTIYHECGHVYHKHGMKGLPAILANAAFSAVAMAKIYRVLPPETAKKVALGIIIPIYTAIMARIVAPYYTRPREKEADLFACDQLVKAGRPDIVWHEIKYPSTTIEHFEQSLVSDIFSLARHPSAPESKIYLKQCLKDHGYEPKKFCVQLTNKTKNTFSLRAFGDIADITPGQSANANGETLPNQTGTIIIDYAIPVGGYWRTFSIPVVYKHGNKCLNLEISGPDYNRRYTLKINGANKTYTSGFHEEQGNIKEVIEL